MERGPNALISLIGARKLTLLARRGFVLSILICGLIVVETYAQSRGAQYRVDQYTTGNGLPQNTVAAITQTRDGYLWFATYDGLVRYDGMRFTVFDRGNSEGISSNQFLSL